MNHHHEFPPVERILTHAGGAHMDEVIAVALLRHRASKLGHPKPVIERVREVPDQIPETTYVVDIGNRYEPEMRRFDHHQERSLPAAFVMVAEWLEVDELLKPWAAWFEVCSGMDTNLFGQMAKLGVSKENVHPLCSTLGILQNALIKRFELDANDSVFWTVVDGWIEAALGRARRLTQKWEKMPGGTVKSVKGLTVLDLRSLERGDDDNIALSSRLSEIEHPAVVITPDDRGGGWSLFRYLDHPQVDFSLLEGDSAVLFTHKAGFIAKTKTVADNPFSLIERAIIPVKG